MHLISLWKNLILKCHYEMVSFLSVVHTVKAKVHLHPHTVVVCMRPVEKDSRVQHSRKWSLMLWLVSTSVKRQRLVVRRIGEKINDAWFWFYARGTYMRFGRTWRSEQWDVNRPLCLEETFWHLPFHRFFRSSSNLIKSVVAQPEKAEAVLFNQIAYRIRSPPRPTTYPCGLSWWPVKNRKANPSIGLASCWVKQIFFVFTFPPSVLPLSL